MAAAGLAGDELTLSGDFDFGMISLMRFRPADAAGLPTIMPFIISPPRHLTWRLI